MEKKYLLLLLVSSLLLLPTDLVLGQDDVQVISMIASYYDSLGTEADSPLEEGKDVVLMVRTEELFVPALNCFFHHTAMTD